MKAKTKTVRLGDVLTIYNGANYSVMSTSMTKDISVPVYGSGGVMGYTDKSMHDGTSIFLPRKGTLTNIGFYKGPHWNVDTMYWAITNDEIASPYYLYYYLKHLDLSGLWTGSSVPSMTMSAYYSINCNIPDLETQHKIARTLHLLDEKIALNKKVNAELEQLMRAIYDYWFVQFDFPAPAGTLNTSGDDISGKPYKSSGGQMVWNEQLKREVPYGWEVEKVQDLLQKVSDTSIKIASNSILSIGEYPVITQDVGNLIKGYTNMDTPIKDIPLLVFGDHSCTIRYVNLPFFRGADGTQLLKFANSTITNFGYLYLEKRINQIPNYGKYERHYKYIKVVDICMPSNSILSEFSGIIQPVLDSLRDLIQQSEQLTSLRDFLLPMLLNGQVVVDE